MKALEKAQMQAQTPPAETQIAQAILERAKKRMVGADEKIRQAAEASRQAESEKICGAFESSVSTAFHYSTLSDPNPPNGMEAEVERLRAQGAQLQAQVQDPPAAKRRAVGSGRTVSTMPNTLILGEVSAWVEECHVLMLDAVNVGDRNRVLSCRT